MRKRIGRIFVAALFIGLIVVLAPRAKAMDLKPLIDPLAKPLIDKGVAVGFVVGIFKDGDAQIIGYGETKKGNGHTPDADAIYEIGSVSKVFTSTVLADMVLAGKVKLDDPVQKYLPDTVKMPVKDDKPITLAHLATHTSGLPRMPNNFTPADPGNPYADYTVEQMYAFLNGCQLQRAPGEYEYSNLGAALLGHVLALVEGVPYEKMLLDHISRPLVMQDTRITLKAEQLELLAPPYDAELKPVKNWDLPTFAGAGAIRSTARDMLRFIAANLRKDDQPLSRAMQLAQQKQDVPKQGQAMGLGWHIAADGALWHNGMTAGYHSYLTVVPERNLGVVVLANTAAMQLSDLGDQIKRIAEGKKVVPPHERKAIEVDPAVLANYAGVYAIAPEFALRVTLDDNQLMVQATTDQEKYPVFAESPTTFFYRVADAQLTFVPDENGKVNEMQLQQGALSQTAKRVVDESKFKFPKQRKAIDVDPAVLATYVGLYSIVPQFALTVTVEDGKLMVQATAQPQFQVFAESPTEFFYKVVDAQLTFVPGADGKVESLILHQNGQDLKGTRKD